MYYPKQIPYLLDKEFQANITYQEYQIKSLSHHCMCIWTMQSRQVLNKTIYNYILPDACIDIVIDFTNQTICFAGFSKDTVPFQLQQQIDFMGVRLKPSTFYTLFHIPADKIMDSPINFFDVEKDPQLASIFQTTNQTQRINQLTKYLLTKIQSCPDNQYLSIIDELYDNPKDQTVLEIANRLGYNQRHLYRMFKKQYGLSPKVLLNILRLHLCLTLILENNISLIDIASRCGFYDQSHFIKEIKKYTGFSPLKLLANYQ